MKINNTEEKNLNATNSTYRILKQHSAHIEFLNQQPAQMTLNTYWTHKTHKIYTPYYFTL